MSKSINIAIDGTILDGTIGGVQNVLESLGLGFKEYSPQNISIYWFVLHHTNWWKTTIPKNHRVIKVGRFSSLLGKIIIKLFPKIAKIIFSKFYNNRVHDHNQEIKKYVKEYEIQLIHCLFQNGFTTTDIPYIYHPHDLQHKYFPQYFTLQDIERREIIWKGKAKDATLNIVETEIIKSDLIKFWNISEDKITTVISPPPKLENTIKNQIQRPYAIYQSAFWEHKNHLTLIDAFELLRDLKIDCKLYLIGNIDSNAKKIRNYIKKRGLDKQITLTGYITRNELSEYLYGCDFVVIPSLYESLSLPGFEALYAEKSIICSDISQFRYQFGSHARYFNPKNKKELAEKIKNILEEKQELNSGFRSSNLANLTSKEFSKAFCAIYRKILNLKVPDHEATALEKIQIIRYFDENK